MFGSAPPDIINKVIICEKYGWTEQQYDEQSEDFINAIHVRYSIEKEQEPDR